MINTPVNLRSILVRPVGEAIGMLAGGIIIRMRHDKRQGFWDNARIYHEKLHRAIRPEKLFQFSRVLSKTVPIQLMKQVMLTLIDNMASTHPFVITNYGPLDKIGIPMQARDLRIMSLYMGVHDPLGTITLVVFTINKSLHFCMHYNQSFIRAAEIERISRHAIESLHVASS